MQRFSLVYVVLLSLKTILFLLAMLDILPQKNIGAFLWVGVAVTGGLIVYYLFCWKHFLQAEKLSGFFMLCLLLAADVFFWFIAGLIVGAKSFFNFDFGSFG